MESFAWDVTVGATLAESYVEAAARESGAVAEQAAQRKLEQEVKVIWQKAPHGGPIPRLGSPQGVEICTIEFLG